MAKGDAWRREAPLIPNERKHIDWHQVAHRLTETRHQAFRPLEPLLKPLQSASSGRVLDACCGTGYVAIQLARQGLSVWAVDWTPAFLEHGQALAREAGAHVQWILDDMRTYRHPEPFDGALVLEPPLGLFRDPEDDRQLLRNVHHNLAPGCLAAFTIHNYRSTVPEASMRNWIEHGVDLLEQLDTLNAQERELVCRDLFAKGLHRERFGYNQRLYSPAQLKDLLRECGFTTAQTWETEAPVAQEHPWSTQVSALAEA